MNIFVTSSNPEISAQNLDDKRVIKMAVESAQMLSTAQRYYGNQVGYKACFVNHPCNIWVRKNISNYWWLYLHYESLLKEYTRRFGKYHASGRFVAELSNITRLPNVDKQEDFCNCSFFKDMENVIEAYRLTMKAKWAMDKREPTWTNGGRPEWLI